MPRYLISFDDGAMDHIPDADWPAVGHAAHEVTRAAKAAGVWIFGGGIQRQQSTIAGISSLRTALIGLPQLRLSSVAKPAASCSIASAIFRR